MTTPVIRIYWHGTSSTFLEEILANGLLPTPVDKSDRMIERADWENRGSRSLHGVYVTRDPRWAMRFAQRTTEHFGGSQMMIAIEGDEKAALPDEDNIMLLRTAHDVVEELGTPWDSGYLADLRLRMSRDRATRIRCTNLMVTFGHEWRFRAPKSLAPDRELLLEAFTAVIDRTLVHLTWNDYVAGRISKMRKPPFSIPASPEEKRFQENRVADVLDRLCHTYLHLREEAYSRCRDEHSIRFPNSVGFERVTRITGMAVRTPDNDWQSVWGDISNDLLPSPPRPMGP
jgi:hypothetical protein